MALERHSFQANLQRILVFLLPCLLVFAPLGFHYATHPRDLSVRVSEVSIIEVIKSTDSYSPLWENMKKYALMFNYKGSADPRHNLPNEPQLDGMTSIFFVLGFAYYLRLWRSSHHLLVILWFGLGLLGGLLSHPTDAPNAYRTAMINPVACLFAGTSINYFLTAVYQRLQSFKFSKLVAALLAATLLAYAAVDNYRIHFIRRPGSPATWREENLDWGIPRIIKSLGHESATFFLDPLLIWDSVIVNSWFLNYQTGKLFVPAYIPSHIFRAPETPASEAKMDAYIIYLSPPPFLPLIQKVFPEAQTGIVSTPFGKDLYAVTKLKTSDWQTRLGSANNKELAVFAYEMAHLYKNRAAAFMGSGPVRNFLLEQSAKEFAYAKELDPSFSQESVP